jgi:hypothetical protein
MFLSCRRDDIQPVSTPKLLPKAVYQLSTARFDTTKPLAFQQLWYDSNAWLTKMHRRFYLGGLRDVYHDFVYDHDGNIVKHITVDQSGYKDSSQYVYRLGIPFFAYSRTENASYIYDYSGRLIERNDTLWSLRIEPYINDIVPQKTIYNYTDSGIIETRFVQTRRGMVETAKTYIKFHVLVSNPFEHLQTRVDHLYSGILFPSYHYMHYAKQGMVSEMKSILPNGKVNSIWKFDILKKMPGNNYPQVVRTTIIGYSNFGPNDTVIHHYHFQYKEIY